MLTEGRLSCLSSLTALDNTKDHAMDASPDTVNTPFNHWWLRTGAWVEPPNQRRGGESGVQILAPITPEQP